MSYTDEEIILDRQMLIAIAENKSCREHKLSTALLRRDKMLSHGNQCVFIFNGKAAWDDGNNLKKLEGPHLILLEDPNGLKLPNQKEFQYCQIKIKKRLGSPF